MKTWIALALCWIAAAPGAIAGDSPNLLFLLTDDQRWDTLGYAGNAAVKTPNVDRLAADGVVFDNAFTVTSICAVSRACILLSQYPRRSGINDFHKRISKDQWKTSYPALLQKAGYETGFIGKWGVGAPNPKRMEQMPPRFDFWAGFPDQGHYWHAANCAWATHEGADCTCPPTPGLEPWQRGRGHDGIKNPSHLTTTIIPELFARFLDERKASKPFCMSISFKAPHAPWQDWDPALKATTDDINLPPAPDSIEAPPPEFLQDTLNVTQAQQLLEPAGKREEWLKHYYRLINGIDVAVGKIQEALREHDLDDSTVIVFTSDNGTLIGEHGMIGKWLMHEESIRVPLVIRDPAAPIEERGKRCARMVTTLDLGPTLLELGGATVPETMQGQSLAPLLRDPNAPFRGRWFYEHHFSLPEPRRIARSEGVRTAHWKYVRYLDENPPVEQIFDIAADPLELNDLADQPEFRQQLLELRSAWESDADELR